MDEELDDDEGLCLPARPWSWFWFLESLSRFAGATCKNFGTLLEEGLGEQFAMMHNRKIERDDQRDVARDVLSDIERL